MTYKPNRVCASAALIVLPVNSNSEANYFQKRVSISSYFFYCLGALCEARNVAYMMSSYLG